MKKLIVLSVIFALVAGSVFAADVSVTVMGKANLFEGSNVEKVDVDSSTADKTVYTTKEFVGTGFDIGRIRIDANGATEDGTVGAYLRFEGDHHGSGPSGVNAWGYVWYKPADIIKITFGSNGYDGFFGLDGVARWNYYQLGGDVGFIPESWKFGASFFGGWGGDNKGGLILTSNPIEALEINLAFPIGGISDAYKNDDPTKYSPLTPAYKKYQQFTVQAKYNIDGVGTAGITYANSLFNYSEDDPKLWAYFGLSSIENLGIDVGIGYKFPDVTSTDTVVEVAGKKNGMESTTTTNYPLALGVAANFSSGALGVKARVQTEFLGSKKIASTVYVNGDSKSKETSWDPSGLNMVIDVQPSFAINETLTAYLSTGIYFKTGEEYQEKLNDDGDPVYAKETRALVGWHVQPYVVITPSYWNGAFFAGFRLESPQPDPFDGNGGPGGDGKGVFFNGEKGDVRNRILYWSIPIGVSFSY
jgi:hypothetical protein